jgi:glycosyltransferase involved in cell wall biosynthesis
MSPKVSIILPTYNRCQFLPQAIESVLRQTFKDFELIIINDGSTDGTKDFLKTIKDERIIIINQENMGLTKSLNRGLKVARGEFIARIDDDDIWIDHEKLEKQVNFLTKYPEYVLCGGGAIVIDEKGKELFRWLLPETDEKIRNKILFQNQFIHPSVVFRKNPELFYSEDLKVAQDWEFWLRLGKVGKLFNFQSYFVKLRSHQKSVSSRNYRLEIKSSITIIKNHKNDYPHFKKAILYNYLKLCIFSLPGIYQLFRKIIKIRNQLIYRKKTIKA